MFLFTQENILQKVVMTAFADRTVVTIAVSTVSAAAVMQTRIRNATLVNSDQC